MSFLRPFFCKCWRKVPNLGTSFKRIKPVLKRIITIFSFWKKISLYLKDSKLFSVYTIFTFFFAGTVFICIASLIIHTGSNWLFETLVANKTTAISYLVAGTLGQGRIFCVSSWAIPSLLLPGWVWSRLLDVNEKSYHAGGAKRWHRV